MSIQTQPVNMSSSSSSSLSNSTGQLQNVDLNGLANQIANVLQINKISDTLENLTNQLVYLYRKVDQKFGETEKLFSDPNDSRVKDNQFPTSISSSTSIPNQIEFPELVSKDSKICEEKS
jgi:hypothetical protein